MSIELTGPVRSGAVAKYVNGVQLVANAGILGEPIFRRVPTILNTDGRQTAVFSSYAAVELKMYATGTAGGVIRVAFDAPDDATADYWLNESASGGNFDLDYEEIIVGGDPLEIVFPEGVGRLDFLGMSTASGDELFIEGAGVAL